MLRCGCLLVLSIASCGGGDRAASSSGTATVAVPFAPPRLDAPFVSGAEVRLDGVLDEPAWERAAKTGPFVGARSGKPQPGSLQGKARVFWDGEHLYVAVEIDDARVRGGFPEDAVDPHLWERDTAEIMIDPDGADNRDYYEIQINPQGLVFDSRFDDYNLPNGGPSGPFGHEDWSSGVERGVKIAGTIDEDGDRDLGYVVEARVPWRSFDRAEAAPPRPGDVWRMNLYAMQDNGGVAWSPILGEGNFHRTRFWGEVAFAE